MPQISASRVINVLLVDDHELVRRGVRALLKDEPQVHVVGDVPLTGDAVSVITAEHPDVIVVEPDGLSADEKALEIIGTFANASTESRILILTNLRHADCYSRFVARGALGLVLKHQPASVLVKAIKKLYEGEVWLERRSTAQFLEAAARSRRADGAVEAQIRSLTKREREIITNLCHGLRNEQIASRLFISDATVRNHVTSILHKLDLANRFELVVFAFRHNLCERHVA